LSVPFELSSRSIDAFRGGNVVYPLKRKNYDDLRLADLIGQRILVVVLVPREESE